MNLKKKNLKINKEDVYSLIYVIIMALLYIETPSSFWNSLKAIFVIVILFLPFMMITSFKVVNTIILGAFVWASSKTIFLTNETSQIRFSQGITYFIFFLFLVNILIVLAELYKLTKPINTKGIVNYIYRFVYKYRFIYAVFSIIALVAVILSSFQNIYHSIYTINHYSFNGYFESLYLSFTTFFTIGYGDITPVSYNARIFVMTQMILSYFVTAMILPIMIVIIFKLIENKSNESNEEKKSNDTEHTILATEATKTVRTLYEIPKKISD